MTKRKIATIVLSLLLSPVLGFSLKAQDVSDIDLEMILLQPRDPFVSPLDVEELPDESKKKELPIEREGEFMERVEEERLRRLQTEKEKIEKERVKLKIDLEDLRKTLEQERQRLSEVKAEKSEEEKRLEEAKQISEELEKEKKRIDELNKERREREEKERLRLQELLSSLNLKGIIWHKDRAVAIIDDKIFFVGESYKECQIEEITPEGITLRFKDELISLRLR